MHDYRTTTLIALACALASACMRPADVAVDGPRDGSFGRSTAPARGLRDGPPRGAPVAPPGDVAPRLAA